MAGFFVSQESKDFLNVTEPAGPNLKSNSGFHFDWKLAMDCTIQECAVEASWRLLLYPVQKLCTSTSLQSFWRCVRANPWISLNFRVTVEKKARGCS